MIAAASIRRDEQVIVVAEAAGGCPMCHTVDTSITESTLTAGGYWMCARCGQTWDANRLAVRAAYDRFEEARR